METPEHRSQVMRAVKSRDTKPEMIVRRLLHAKGYRYRLHAVGLPGKPDIVFPSRRKLIFVHGCFWHGHDCARGARIPKTNEAYWKAKIARNIARDAEVLARLDQAGWSALVVWECRTRDQESLIEVIDAFLDSADQPPKARHKTL